MGSIRQNNPQKIAGYVELKSMSASTLATVGRFLVEYGLLGILVTMPPALFLLLGLKAQNRLAIFFGGGLFLALGCAILGITIEGISTGEGLALSRSVLMVNLASQPIFFWVSTAAFLIISLAIAAFGILLVVGAFMPFKSAANAKKSKTGRPL